MNQIHDFGFVNYFYSILNYGSVIISNDLLCHLTDLYSFQFRRTLKN